MSPAALREFRRSCCAAIRSAVTGADPAWLALGGRS